MRFPNLEESGRIGLFLALRILELILILNSTITSTSTLTVPGAHTPLEEMITKSVLLRIRMKIKHHNWNTSAPLLYSDEKNRPTSYISMTRRIIWL
jgi:hypothetical protein